MPYQWELRPYRRRFKQPLQTSHGVWTLREGIILRLVDDAGRMGWGEIAPISWFGSETMAQALAFCRQLPAVLTDDHIFAIPDALPACQFGFESAWEGMRAVVIDPMAPQRRRDAVHLASVATENATLPPPNAIVAAQNSDVAVQNSIVTAQSSTLLPPNSDVAVQNSDIAVQSSIVPPQNSDIAVQNSDIAVQNAIVPHPNAIVPPQNSDIAALNAIVAALNQNIAHPNAIVPPQNRNIAPQNSIVTDQNSIVAAQSSIVAPQNATLPLQNSDDEAQNLILQTQSSTPQTPNPIPPSPHPPTPHTLPLSALLPAGIAALNVWKPLWAQGFRTFKWKIGVSTISTELEILHRLTQALPPTAKLRLDANGGLSLAEATQWLQVCDALADQPNSLVTIEYMEQPLPIAQFAAMQSLSQRYETPIALDESVATLQPFQACYANGWRGIFIIKPAIVGSPSRLRQFCQTHAIDAVFSSAFETAIGRQAGLKLAAALGNRDRAIGYGTTHWFAKTVGDFKPRWP